MAVYCRTCGKESADPGGNLSNYACGNCGRKTLYRTPAEEEKVGKVAGSGVGAAIGAGVAGPLGAIVGALLGFVIGDVVDKENKK